MPCWSMPWGTGSGCRTILRCCRRRGGARTASRTPTAGCWPSRDDGGTRPYRLALRVRAWLRGRLLVLEFLVLVGEVHALLGHVGLIGLTGQVRPAPLRFVVLTAGGGLVGALVDQVVRVCVGVRVQSCIAPGLPAGLCAHRASFDSGVPILPRSGPGCYPTSWVRLVRVRASAGTTAAGEFEEAWSPWVAATEGDASPGARSGRASRRGACFQPVGIG